MKKFKQSDYSQFALEISQNTLSFNGSEYICLTCSKKVKNNKVPCQTVCNKLKVSEIPHELSILNKLEIALISKRLLFKKIAIMSKGQMPKMKGAICNAPVSVNDISLTLPRNLNSSGIILVKLKKKLEFNGHVYFEPVSPE